MYIFDITVEEDEIYWQLQIEVDLQIELFVPNRIVCSVQCLCAYSHVAQFKHSKWIAVAYRMETDDTIQPISHPQVRTYRNMSSPQHCLLKNRKHDGNATIHTITGTYR